jgi:hypothetical protein
MNALAYGAKSPFISQKILDGPIAPANDNFDNDNDGLIDEPNEKMLMNSYITTNNNATYCGNPFVAQHFYFYMQAKWKDAFPLTYGGDGYTGFTSAKFMYDGLFSNAANPWIDTLFGDYRGIASTGPFTWMPNQKLEYEYAYIFNWDTTAADYNGSYSKQSVLNDYRQIQRAYDQQSFPTCLDLSTVDVSKVDAVKEVFALYPNPVTSTLHISSNHLNATCIIEISDARGIVVSLTNQVTGSSANGVINIATDAFASGLYVVRLMTTTKTLTGKFIKE